MIQQPVMQLTKDELIPSHMPLYVNRVKESFHLPLHSHDFIEINLVCEGYGFHYINDRTIPSAKGDLFIIPVGESHVFRPSSTNTSQPFSVYNIVIRPDALEPWLAVASNAGDIRELFQRIEDAGFRLPNCPPAVSQLVENMHLEYEVGDRGSETILMGQLLQLLTILIRRLRHGDETERLSPVTIQSLIEHMRHRYADSSYSLGELAEVTGLTVNQLHYRIRKYLGMSFTHYIRKLRIEECCRLLETTDAKVYRIAEQVGYHDLKFFHAVFKAETGLTPFQYRRRLLGSEDIE